MKAPALVALGAVSLWAAGSTAVPADASTVPSPAHTARIATMVSTELSSLAVISSSSHPTAGTQLFEVADSTSEARRDSCGDGLPDIIRGSGGGGSKHRHSAPTTKRPCRPSTAPASPGLLSFDSSSDVPPCSGDGRQPETRPTGGDNGKKRHSPADQRSCQPQPRQASVDASGLNVLGMTLIPFGTGVSLDNPDTDSPQPGGGSGGKHRHSPPSKRPPGLPPSRTPPGLSGLQLG